jgi:U3 small nucleolar RNA-associated protein 20
MALGESFSLAEKHNRDLVPFFLSFAGPESSSKLPRFKLNAWLTLFSKFTNPKALHSTDVLHSLYLSLLSHPDRSLQRLSLTCLLAYKSAHLSPHEDGLTALLDDTRWREELTALDMDKFQSQDRPELVGVIIRLLFGMMLEKRGRSRGVDRRAAILGALGGCTDQELELLVDLMLRPMESDSSARREGEFGLRAVPAIISEKQQVGYLTLLGDVLKNLGPRLIACWPALLGTTIDLLGHSQSRIESAQQQIVGAEAPEDEADMEELDDVDELGSSSKITRSVRQLGLKRFADFFRNPGAFDFAPYMGESFRAFISPRLPTLDRENTQAPSALLEIVYAWTLEREHMRFLVDFDSRTLPQVYACLVATNVKPAVISRIFDIVDRILAFPTDEFMTERVIKPHASLLLTNLALLVERTQGVAVVSSPLGQRQIGILSEIAQYLTDATQAATLLGLFSPLLRKPPKLVAEKVKVNLLKITSNLLPLIPDLSDRSTHVFIKTYDLLARLFQSLRSSQARIALVTAFHRLAQLNPTLQPLADLLGSLNAYSARRIDEPNFDCRLEAFATLNETSYISLTNEDWLAVLYNMLSFIQDANELAVRTNASYTLKRFVDLVASSTGPEYEAQFVRMLYPGLKNGLRSKNELVRAEVLGVIAYAVTKCDRIDFLREMQVLLAGGDEEANFFNNIHHVQIHRRTRALRRLGDQCAEHCLRSTTLADIFVPLVSNYIVTAASLDHHLVNEAIITTGRMAKQLAWGAYYALVQRYLKLSRDRDESERVYVRTLVAVLENFHFPMEEIVPPLVLDVDADAEEDDGEPDDPSSNTVSSNNMTSPPAQLMDTGKIADAVNLRLLPNLLHHLEKRDVTEDSLRIPISIGIVRVAKHLPEATREPQIARLLTILSQILRSKSPETRDLTRDTLCRIAVILGSSYLPIMMREMRGALLRGPQLHVLAYVVHALLAYVTTTEHAESFQALDGCVGDVAHVSAEVVFGESGKDVQSEDFKTKMREVRSSSAKGLDSFAIMAKYITPSNTSGLLYPLRSIMQETQSVKTIQLVDEVLRRVASGLNSNKHLAPAELLVLCHTLISQNARFLKDVTSSRKRKGTLKGDAIVQIKRQVTVETDHYGNNSFR